MASVTRMLAAKPQTQPAAPKPAPASHTHSPAAATVRATPASEERLAAPEDRFIGMTGAQVRGGEDVRAAARAAVVAPSNRRVSTSQPTTFSR
jgi:hypothetical protein